MRAADYIVEYLAGKGIKHFFGYQGTMIANFVDAIEKNSDVQNHSAYNEQGAAFAACGYAQASNGLGVAYSTSGPGAINLMSGIANAYYDSIPVLFITGQVNTTDYTGITALRQQAFQETDIVSAVKGITKYAVQIKNAKDVQFELEKAVQTALEGRRGPVLLDIPMNIQKAEVFPQPPISLINARHVNAKEVAACIKETVENARRPVFLIGNGVHDNKTKEKLIKICLYSNIPVITSLLNIIDYSNPCNMGYIGSAYGQRSANIIACEKADLLVAFGMSLCPRQIRGNTKAHIIQVDIDEAELQKNDNVTGFKADVKDVVKVLKIEKNYSNWLSVCTEIKKALVCNDYGTEWSLPNQITTTLSNTILSECSAVVSDVGQHMIWVANSFHKQKGQKLLFSGGHGAMGYALPAAIGAYYALGKPVACICGDGAFQMNIQELQWVSREKIPIYIIVMNNNSLGLIRQQQSDFFDSFYAGAVPEYGFSSPDFTDIAKAYKIESDRVTAAVDAAFEKQELPYLYEIVFEGATYAYPKTYFGEKMTNQRPYISEETLEEINGL